MKMHFASSATIVAFLAGVAVTGCGIDDQFNATSAQPAPAAESGASTGGQAPSELRDYRYCEVIPSVTEGDTTTTYVWNTTGSNLCPPELWNSLTEAQVNQDFGSQSAQLNGPRHWMMDSISATGESTTGQTFTFGGIEFNLRAILTTPAGQPTVGQQFYVPNQVQRDTTYTYKGGRPIFELTDPDGNVYVMQSYAQIVDPTLTYEQLPSLASKLNLPEGWTYSTKTPVQDFELVATGLAYVINDDLANSYQRRPLMPATRSTSGRPPTADQTSRQRVAAVKPPSVISRQCASPRDTDRGDAYLSVWVPNRAHVLCHGTIRRGRHCLRLRCLRLRLRRRGRGRGGWCWCGGVAIGGGRGGCRGR